MTYARVIPRDLFNEASLLKCLGRLAILLGDMQDHHAKFDPNDEFCGRFMIEQDPDDGSIFVGNLPFTVAGEERVLHRPLNSRAPWPLYVLNDALEDVPVFDVEGDLTPEFLDFIKEETE